MVKHTTYSKTCLKRPLKKKTKIGFQDQLSLNAGQKYYAILSTFIKLPFVIKIFVCLFLSGRLDMFYCIFSVLTIYKAVLWSTAVIALYRIRQNHIEHLC